MLEPILEADFKPCSYGFRRGRRVQDAIAEIHFFTSHSYEWIVEGDIKACFDEISHVGVQDRLRARVADKRILLLVKAFLKAGILSREGVERHPITGTPQGGILSPLLSNLALSVLDEHFAAAWESFATDWARRSRRSKGLANYRLVRYADDWVRHEAPYDRAEMKGLRREPVAAGSRRWGKPDLGDAREGGSSPDNDGTGWDCQTAWVRQSRREGVTRVNQWQSPVSGVPTPNLADMGRSAAHAHRADRGGRLRMPGEIAGPEAMVKDCGVAMARLPGHSWAPTSTTGRMSERGNRLGSPSWLAIQAASGQVHRRLMTRRRGGASVLVVGLTPHQGDGKAVHRACDARSHVYE